MLYERHAEVELTNAGGATNRPTPQSTLDAALATLEGLPPPPPKMMNSLRSEPSIVILYGAIQLALIVAVGLLARHFGYVTF